MTEASTSPTPAERADGADSAQKRFTTTVEVKEDGQWVAVVHLGDGTRVCKLFDSEAGAYHYGDELADWLESRRSD